jgi:NADPH:quinone reductase
VKELGVDIGVDASKVDWPTQVDEEAGANGVDAILDLVGGNYLEGNLRVLALKGRIVVVGLTAGHMAQFNMGILLRKRGTVVGTTLRARPVEEKIALARDFSARMIPLFGSGRLKPIVDRVLSFDQIAEAHRVMESNATLGKLVLVWR